MIGWIILGIVGAVALVALGFALGVCLLGKAVIGPWR